MSRSAIDVDEIDESWPLLSRFRRYGVPHAHVMVAGLMGTVVSQVATSTGPFIIGIATDALFNDQPYELPLVPAAVIPDEPLEQLWLTGGLLLFLYLVDLGASYVGNYLRGVFGLLVRHDLRVDVYDAAQRLELAFFDDQQTGQLVSILNNDVDELRSFFKDEIAFNLNQFVQVSAALVFMTLLNWRLTLLLFVSAPIFAGINYWLAGRIEAIQLAIRDAVGDLNARIEDNVSGIDVIKASGTEPFESARVAEASRDHLRAHWDGLRFRTTVYPVISLLSNGTYVLAFVLGGYWVLFGAPGPLAGTLTGGQLFAFLLYTKDLSWTLRSISFRVDSYKSAKAAAKRVAVIHRTDRTITEADDAIALADVDGEVEYDGVTFGYDPEDPVIHDVSFDVAPGETVGLVGETGAGKSTLVKLLLRFYEVTEGAIRVDGNDIRDVTLRSLRESIGYVSQEPFLFYGTVEENIAYGDPDATDSDIRDAAKVANAHEFVERLPDGYDTEVGERGAKLSGGQRQRIAIARAVVSDPPILIFDEATSHVDNETEVLIKHSMQQLTEDRTTFVIAHRLSTVKNTDTILVMDDGEIIERGSHDELLDADGTYARLWAVQVGQVDALPDDFVERSAGS